MATEKQINAVKRVLAHLPTAELKPMRPYGDDDGYADGSGYAAAILSLIERLEKAETQRDAAYRALVCFDDDNLRDPHWDDHCRVQEKARAFVEGNKK